jgi:hypothetical protein
MSRGCTWFPNNEDEDEDEDEDESDDEKDVGKGVIFGWRRSSGG